ncbi:uncharacterized protein LOC133184509 [Saccostrea echinata]|uniref:uncharacterized protein LOC133184509 n=1 Tax=Saccostrea echinata TaxID=191078 RepID=UPI002A837B2D|nr:uncharacterized protein LOC133184509 [Saccostrea echinata]
MVENLRYKIVENWVCKKVENVMMCKMVENPLCKMVENPRCKTVENRMMCRLGSKAETRATEEEIQRLTQGEASPRGHKTQTGESRIETSQPKVLLTMKAATRIGTWNVRTMFETGKAAQVAREMRRYNIQLLGICESRWNGTGTNLIKDYDSKIPLQRKRRTVIQCYPPTNTADEETKEDFYTKLQAAVDKAPRRDMKILMGDMNAKIGSDNYGKEFIMGTQALGNMNENGELFTDFCAFNDLVIGGSAYQHKNIHKETWISPDGKTKNQIDFITISRKWRRSFLDTRSRRGADVASDHHLVQGTIKVKLKAFKDNCDRPHIKFNTQRLQEKGTRDTFSITLKNRFEVLNNVCQVTPLEEHWNSIKDNWKDTCEEILEKREKQDKEWLSRDTWKLVEERKLLKQQVMSCEEEQKKQELKDRHTILYNEVKKSARRDKRHFYNKLATEAEEAAEKRDVSTMYKITRTLAGKRPPQTKPVKDKEGNAITKEEDQRKRWAELFRELLNRPTLETTPNIPPADSELAVITAPPTRAETIKALKKLKSGKAAGPDGIPPEALKADIKTSADMLLPLLQKIWSERKVPADWKKGHLVKLPKKGDLGQCKNWRGIMLLSVPSKILTRIILERLKDAI